MADNVLGAVSIQIVGDSSRLPGDIAKAQQLAQRGGAQIAEAFNSAFTAGTRGASGLVDQFGRSLQGLQQPTNQAAQSFRQMAAAGDQLAQSLIRLVGAEVEEAAAAKAMGAAHGGAVTQIQATSGALRVLEGSGGIRAAERFLTLIPGLGALAQLAFPVVGAIALFDAFKRGIDESVGLEKRLEALKAAAQEADTAIQSLGKTIDSLGVKSQARQFGPASGLRLQGQQELQDADRAFTEAAAIRTKLAALREEFRLNEGVNPGLLVPGVRGKIIRADKAQLDAIEQEAVKAEAKGEELQRKAADTYAEMQKARTDIGRTESLARLDNERQAATRAVDSIRSAAAQEIAIRHDAELASIGAYNSTEARAIATAEEEVRLAEEKRRALVTNEDQQIDFAKRKAAIESQGIPESEKATIQIRLQGEIASAQARYSEQRIASDRDIEQARAQLNTVVVNAIRQEEEEQRKFNETIEHENALWKERLQLSERRGNPGSSAGLPDIAGQRNPTAELAGTTLGKLNEIRAAGVQTAGAQQAQVKELERIFALEQQTNQPVQARLETEKKILDAKIAIAAAEGKADNKDSLARARVELQQILIQWKTVSAGGVAGTAVNTIAQGVNGVAAALSRATLAGRGFGQAIVQVGKQIAGSLLTTVLEAGLKRVLASLIGLVPAFASVGAAQTSAALAAKGILSAVDVGEAEGNAAVAATGAAAAVAFIPIIGPALAAAAAASTFASLQPYVALAGFADGGRPPVGIPSIVGERGPELFIPDGSGTIVPNHQLGGSVSLPSGVSNSSSTSTGDLHFHAHGMATPRQFIREVARQIPQVLKTANPGHSPYAR